MSNCTFLLQVWFGKRTSDGKWVEFLESPFSDHKGRPLFSLCDQKLWLHEGKTVYAWAADFVVCSDLRWTIFGPYEDELSANMAIESIKKRAPIYGYLITPEHCYKPPVDKQRWWTDG